jgi:hypothetical protein
MTDTSTEASPWLERPDWAAGRINSSQFAGLLLPWIFATAFCGVTSAYLIGYGLLRDPAKVLREPSYLALTPFVLVSIGLLTYALRSTFVALTSGASTFEMTSIPGVVGGELAGVVHVPRQLRAGDGVRLILNCQVIPWTTSGGKSHCSPYTAWEDDCEVSPEAMLGDAVPLHFAIPATALPTTKREDIPNGWRAVRWTLEALVEPGSRWRGLYEVPVFRTNDSPAIPPDVQPTLSNFKEELSRQLHGKAFDESRPERIERPASTRIVTIPTAEGLSLRLPIRTGFLIASLWVLATLPLWIAPLIVARWWPAIANDVTLTRSLVAAFVLNFLPAFFLVIGEPRRIDVGRREIVVHCGWPPFGRDRRFPLDQYDGMDADVQFFSVLRKNGTFLNRRFFLATRLASNAEARWLASVIDGAVSPLTRSGAMQPHA